MIAFSPNNLSQTAQAHLAALQSEVDAATQTSRADGYARAAALWKNRKNRQADKTIWAEIEEKLAANHPRKGLCQYCEFDRTAPTEHFYPKKHFPNWAFRWENYLRICPKCNSEYKHDNFAVFNPTGSTHSEDLPITRGTYPEPPTEDAVLIHPRRDNPQDYLQLDLETGMFLPTLGADARGRKKAIYTFTLLHLNTDDLVRRHRQKSFVHYSDKLATYATIKFATDFPSLFAQLPTSKHIMVRQDHDFATEQNRLLRLFQTDIQDDLFPTVWEEIKTQRLFFPIINAHFNQCPEALTWVELKLSRRK